MYLGIEIGGTKLQLGLGNGDGAIVALEKVRVDAVLGGDGIRKRIIELLPRLLEVAGVGPSAIRSVGVGFGGPVDCRAGTVARSHQVGGWERFPLVAWCRDQWGWPAVLHNDADTAGLAEAIFGAGRGYSPIFYITVGSGIGGGLIVDGRIYRGAGAGAGEIGHLDVSAIYRAVDPDSAPNTPLNDSRPLPLEQVCSGWGIARRLKCRVTDALEKGAAGPTGEYAAAQEIFELSEGDADRIDSEVLLRGVERGNVLARDTLSATCRVLGWAIAQMIALLCPRRVVIGGGVSLMGDALFGPLRTAVASQVFPPFASSYEIVPAALGEQVVVHGALLLARQLYPGTTGGLA